MTSQVHGTCVAVAGVGVLLRGPPGSGKSDLALRLIDRGAELVADDRVTLRREDDGIVASAPAALAGLIEVRGVGVVRVPAVARARLGVVVDLVGAAAVERLPDRAGCELLGVGVPRYRLDAFQASACAKVRLAAQAVNGDTLSEP